MRCYRKVWKAPYIAIDKSSLVSPNPDKPELKIED